MFVTAYDTAGTTGYNGDCVAAPSICTWYIRHIDLFRRLTESDVDELARALEVRRLPAGELIIGPDARPEWVYLIKAGAVRLFQPGPRGREAAVDRLGSGRLFGVTGLVGPASSILHARAEGEVELCMAEGHRFLDVLARWPAALLELLVRLGVRLPAAQEHLGRIRTSGARARLAGTLYRLAQTGSDAEPAGGQRLRRVPKHADLASQIGASRETVTRMLARLEQDGYIRRYGRQIVVPDAERLADDFDLERAEKR
jgi:CRP-like cAMP-binding protein